MTRAGAQALTVLAAPLNVHTLKALKDGPVDLLDLRRAVGSPPQSTMRVYTRALEQLDILERRRSNEFPATAQFAIPPRGDRPPESRRLPAGVAAGSPRRADPARQRRREERDQSADRGLVVQHRQGRGRTRHLSDRAEHADPEDQLPHPRAQA